MVVVGVLVVAVVVVVVGKVVVVTKAVTLAFKLFGLMHLCGQV